MCGPAFIAFAVSLLDFGKTALSPADRRLPLSAPLLSSVIYRTDTSETLRSSSPCRNTSGNSICGSFSHAINPCDFFPSFNAASPSIHYDSIYLGPHVCVCNPKVMNFERFVMRFGPPRIMRFHRPSSFFTTAAGDKGHAMDGIDQFM